jgi:hypothetical protein
MAMMYAQESHGYLPQSCPGKQVLIPGTGTSPSNPPRYHGASDSLFRFSESQAEIIATRYMKGGTKAFYCPSNHFLAPGGQAPIENTDFYPPLYGKTWSYPPGGRTTYWWLGNPNADDVQTTLVEYPPGSGYMWGSTSPSALVPGVAPYGTPAFRDCNMNGTIRDDYMRKLGDKRAPEIVICTDQSGQLVSGQGWYFIHGKFAKLDRNASAADKKKLYQSWKNNLYGDGHAESKRPDEVEVRWGPKGPACW